MRNVALGFVVLCVWSLGTPWGTVAAEPPFDEATGRHAQEGSRQATVIAAKSLVHIEIHSSKPPITTAAEGLRQFLNERCGARAVLAAGNDPGVKESLGTTILLGTPGDTPALAQWRKDGKLADCNPSVASEGYELAVIDGRVVVCGASPRAVLYGSYELQDVIAEQGGVPGDLARHGAPSMKWRLMHPRAKSGFDSYRRSDFEFLARCGANVAHLTHDWISEKTLLSFVPCPEFPRAIRDGHLEEHRTWLRQYLDWCREFGLDAAVWLCEAPCQGGAWLSEATRKEFLDHFPAQCLSDCGTYQGKVLCLAHPLVEKAYRRMARQFFSDFPEIKMVLLFTADSNGELCDPASCPRHRGVSKLVQYNRLVSLLQEEGRAVRGDVHVIAVGFGWGFRGDSTFLAQQAALGAGVGLASPPDGEAWSFDRKCTDALVTYREVTRAHGQLMLGYDIFLWGDDTVPPDTKLYDFPLGVAQKLRRWTTLGADGAFDQWGTQAEFVQSNAVALRELTFHPASTDPAKVSAWAESLAARRFGRAAAPDVLAAWREIEAAQQIQSDHVYYWLPLRPGWAGPVLQSALTPEALRAIQLEGGEPPKPYGAVDYAPYRDDLARARALSPALSEVADHFRQALVDLERAIEKVPRDGRSDLDHWYTPEKGAPPILTPRQLLEEQRTTVRLEEKTQRRMSRFFAAFALARTMPPAGSPDRENAMARLRQLESEDQAGK